MPLDAVRRHAAEVITSVLESELGYIPEVASEEDVSLHRLRRAVFTVFVREMRALLEGLLGIPVPEEM